MICFQCGKRLVDAVGKPVPGLDRDYHGAPVKMHKVCADTFDKDQPVSARAATNSDGRTFVDDEVRANKELGAFRMVYSKPGDET